MIVLRSTYTALRDEHDILRLKYDALLTQWNGLVDVINRKGGKDFLTKGTIVNKQLLTKDDIKRLLPLVHPDKHDGKPAAVEMTQKLLALREAV